MAGWADGEVVFTAADGWRLGGVLRAPADALVERDAAADGNASVNPDAVAGRMPGVVLVPGSRHERDAYTTLAEALAADGVASLRIDVRGRGSSLGELAYARMGPGQRERVALDAAAALETLAATPVVDGQRLGAVVEQDTAADALSGLAMDARLRAVALLSVRYGSRVGAAVAGRAVFGLVSKEDRDGLRATVDGYLAGNAESRLEVFNGLGFGTTMFSTRQFEHGDAEPLEAMIATWLADRLGAGP
ncbi:MAG TPA: hypothetical protein VG478_08070 [Acidimicrobiales bacterium]|jgi:cephalosporin-C deacetylase-like acetyl esterase|nr:hypothetical protein [Acidimicrobiales bacterium]